MINCKQIKTDSGQCTNEAAYRFTWPGRDESFICEEHAPKLLNTAKAIGLYLQLIPLEDKDENKTDTGN